MPARIPIFIQNGFYHVYNRGHNKQPIFLSVKDYQRYMKRLKEYLKKHPVSLVAYCLMPNHVHLLLRQESVEPIEKFVHRLHTAYTMYFNKRYDRIGAVFQGRFKAKPIETDEYLLHVSRYIHLNPFEIISAQGPALNSLLEYPWSSFKEYVSSRKDVRSVPCSIRFILDYFTTHNTSSNQNYLQFIADQLQTITETRLEEISEGNI